MRTILFCCLFVMTVVSSAYGHGCAYWCKSRCSGGIGKISYYCCSYDPQGRPESFMLPECEIQGAKESQSKLNQLMKPKDKEQNEVAINFSDPSSVDHQEIDMCPVSPPHHQRNCRDEMKIARLCTYDLDCDQGEVCCYDNCIQSPLKICKTPIEVPAA